MSSCVIVIAFLCIIKWVIATHFSTINNVTVDIDSTLSGTAHKELLSYIATCANTCHDGHTFLTQIKNNYSYIESVKIDYYQAHTASVTVEAKNPWILINNKQVMMTDGTLCAPYLFNEQSIRNCFTVCVSSDDNSLFAYVYEWAKKVDPVLLRAYSVTWYDITHIELCHISDNQFTIIASHDRPIDLTILNQCQYIKKTHKANITNTLYNHLIADIRFANQIIIFAKKRGGNDRIC